MKRLLIGVLLLALLFIAAVYILIPSKKNISSSALIKQQQEAVTRFLINKGKWNKWFPGEKKSADLYTYKGYDYKIDKIMLNAVDVTVSNDGNFVGGVVKILPDTGGLTKLEWSSVVEFSSNPVARVFQYSKSKKIEDNVSDMLNATKQFFDQQENVYGMKINVEIVKDTSLVSYSQTLDDYPKTGEIYQMIDLVKQYISKNGGKENNSPMMHVQEISPKEYVVMVGIPTSSDVPSQGEFKLKKMIPGNILIGEVKGGENSVTAAEQELKNFVTDFRRISPAIPYQSLVTNRMQEPDTSKWITRLYYPIF